MKHALIMENRGPQESDPLTYQIVQIVETEAARFDVASPLRWETVADDVTERSEWDGAAWVAPSVAFDDFAAAVKAECQRRIYAVADAPTQQRLQNHYTMGKLSAPDRITFEAGDNWIDAMVTRCRELIAANDRTFLEDRHWPIPQLTIVDLAKKY